MKTFEAHGHTWTEHTPGDDMPCDAHSLIEVLLAGEKLNNFEPEVNRALCYEWSSNLGASSIIGWRYAEQKPEPSGPSAEEMLSWLEKKQTEADFLDASLWANLFQRWGQDWNKGVTLRQAIAAAMKEGKV